MHGGGRGIDPRAMQVEVGRNTLEGAGAVEHRRAQPGGVRAHTHDRDIALVPIAFIERPRLRPALSRRHSALPAPDWPSGFSLPRGPRFATIAHDPEKWTPVLGKDHAQVNG